MIRTSRACPLTDIWKSPKRSLAASVPSLSALWPIIDFTLEALEEVLAPALFFRVNRTYILNINNIQDVVMYSNSRLKIATQPAWDKEIIVSREKVGEFKDWFDGKPI